MSNTKLTKVNKILTRIYHFIVSTHYIFGMLMNTSDVFNAGEAPACSCLLLYFILHVFDVR